MRKYILVVLLLQLVGLSFAHDFTERNLFGLGWTYSFPHHETPGMVGVNILFTPMDFLVGFSGNLQTNFSSSTEISLGLERYILLISDSMSNVRKFHLSAGVLGTYHFVRGLGYDIYITTAFAVLPVMGLGLTVAYNHIDSFSFRLEYSGAVFLEKKIKQEYRT